MPYCNSEFDKKFIYLRVSRVLQLGNFVASRRVLCVSNFQIKFPHHFNMNYVLLQVHLRVDADGDHAKVSGKLSRFAISRI